MRQAGTITTKQDAERFANYLLSLGITSKIEPSDGQWALWIHDENQIPRSKQELEQFRLEPNDERYKAAEHAARLARREATEKKKQADRNFIDMRDEWAKPWRRRPITLLMVIASVALALDIFQVHENLWLFSWPKILEGQVWRLVTPVFLHAALNANPLHLVFNMFWLFDLGTLIERRLGSLRFAALVLLVAVASNYGQYLAVGPNFVGMSGVVYGLFGYAWVRGRLDPTSGLYLRPMVPMLMMGWFALCAIGAIPNVANWAHGVGLAAGAALGCLPHLQKTLRRNT
ncbi:MAG: rhomboid family intramembrane serine protease [Pirellulales bacterium]